MDYKIDLTSGRPAYFQLYEAIKNMIIMGDYDYGSKLPSKRTIEADAGVSIITVAHALELLEEEGYIVAKQRRGYFVTYRESDFSQADYMQEDTIFFQDTKDRIRIGHRDEVISYDLISKLMRRVILDYSQVMMDKSEAFGLMELRTEISRYLARSRGIHARPEAIIIGSGAEQLYGRIAGLFDSNLAFAVEDPSYEKITMVYKQRQCSVELLPLDDYGVKSDSLEHSHAKVLHVTPFHSYPSGATADISKKNEYLGWAYKNDAYIVEDNYDSELTVAHRPEESLFSMDKRGRVIYVNTFSKTVATGMRMGYMVLPENLLEQHSRIYENYSCTVPTFDQLLMMELIRSGDFERHINRVRRARRRSSQER